MAQTGLVIDEYASQKAVSQPPAIATSSADPVLAMIERASRDPATDVAKMRELFAMRNEMLQASAKNLFDAAMAAAQSDMNSVVTDKENKQTHSRYATYAALDKAVRTAYTKNGFSLSFDTADSPFDGCTRIVCDCAHNGGFTKSYKIDMPTDGKGAKGNDVMTKTHATGSAVSYGMRYLLKMIFNIATTDKDDDDGQAAGANGAALPITEEQVKELRLLIDKAEIVEASFLKNVAKQERIEDIPQKAFKSSVDQIKAFAQQHGIKL